MIRTSSELSVRRQCDLLGVTRSTVYYEPKPEDEEALRRKETIMGRIDYWHTTMPFARQVFGSDFQVVVGTHLDKAHPHNHIIVNSVSFVDGHKYHSNIESYFNTVRATSDELCRENGLSVIEPQGKSDI